MLVMVNFNKFHKEELRVLSVISKILKMYKNILAALTICIFTAIDPNVSFIK